MSLWKATKGPSVPGGVQCTVKLLDGTDVLLDIAVSVLQLYYQISITPAV